MKLEAAAAAPRRLFELNSAHAELAEVLPTAHRADLIAAARRRYDRSAGGIGRRNLSMLASLKQRMAHVRARHDRVMEFDVTVGIYRVDEKVAVAVGRYGKRDGFA